MIKHVDLIIKGKVQGVFYRASALQIARQLDIKGFAQNLPDGSVHIEAEGEQEKINQFVVWCKKGPKNAVVSDVQINFTSALKDYVDFQIKRH